MNFLANLITAGNPDYWVMFLDLEMKILCVKFIPTSSAIRVKYGKKRVGCPRQNWLHYAKHHVFEYDLGGYDENETVIEDAHI